GECGLRQLEIGDPRSELPAALRSRRCLVERPRRQTARSGPDRRSEKIERPQRNLQTVAGGTEPLARRHAAFFERELADRMRRREIELANDAESRSVCIHHEGRKALACGPWIGLRKYNVKSREPGVRDERFLSGQHVRAAIAARRGLDGGGVGSCFRLCQRKRAEGATGGRGRQVAVCERL